LAGPWLTVLDFLDERFAAVGRDVWLARMQDGLVLADADTPLDANARFQAAQRIYYFRALAAEIPIPFEASIVWHDEHLLVADKPHFLPVLPSGKYVHETLLVRLKKQLRLEALVPVHRIDRDTAGLVLFSVNPATRDAYHALFRNRQVHKTYHAIAPWNRDLPWPLTRESRIRPSSLFMKQAEVPGPANALTHIRPLQINGSQALYELRPVTGQRHQLRVHMEALGLPITGDGIYPVLTPEGEVDFQNPLRLLAKQLSFEDPVTGATKVFESNRHLDWA
jgi:tRNA pseudouridine32 synthase/23S rRNA pseudouridine746 synthase